jgi:hypothetical protein
VRPADGQWVAHGDGRSLPPPGTVPEWPSRPSPAVASLAWVPSAEPPPSAAPLPVSPRDGTGTGTGFEDVDAGGVLVTAGADGTARLWQCRARRTLPVTAPNPAAAAPATTATTAGKTTATASASGAAISRCRVRWRAPHCVGQLNTHLPNLVPSQEAGLGGSGAEPPWLFGRTLQGGSGGSSGGGSGSSDQLGGSVVSATAAAAAALDAPVASAAAVLYF